MDQYIGRLLDNRYEILEIIGTGGMAVVYKARCHRLNRLVAIKILKDEFARDEEFRRRFHAEGEAVAMLSHPNIVQVYDVSSSDNANYIVMELIDGITLKQYMEKKGVLNWKETLHFSMQIAKALEHAHSRSIVHRDIKPHNVMVLKNGSVKVTDFGIARVMSKSNTLTKEALGSVHYISPEQAKGGWVDNRSDLYSLGVVMYEMMAGRPPYDGESPVAVAIQHINGGAPMPSTLNPNIPGGLEQIIMKAMALDPADRYASASEMLKDMEEFRKDPTILFVFPSHGIGDETKVLKTPVASQIQSGTAPQQSPRTVAEKVAGTGAAAAPVNRAPRSTAAPTPRQRVTDGTHSSGGAVPGTRKNHVSSGTRAANPQRAASGDAARRAAANRKARDEIREEIREEERNRVATIAVVACSAVAILAIIVFLIALFNGALIGGTEKVLVPNFVGSYYETLNQDDLQGLTVKIATQAYSATVEEGKVIEQSPDAGEKVAQDTIIWLTISMGPEPEVKIMEDLTGWDYAQAESYLKGQGMVPELIEESSDTVENGKVIRTDPVADTELTAGETVKIYYSTGKTAMMQTVVGKNYDVAVEILNNLGFKQITKKEVASDEPIGTVLEQSVKAGEEIDVTTEIILTVATAETGKMKNVVGKDFDVAAEILNGLGFPNITKKETASDEKEGTVLEQSVKANEEIPLDTEIILTVAKTKTAKMINVVGQQSTVAQENLTDLGFTKVTIEWAESGTEKGRVIDQSVARGEIVPVNTEIVLTVSAGPAETDPPAPQTKQVVLELPGDRTEDYRLSLYQNGNPVVEDTMVKAGTTSITVVLTGTGTQSYDLYINGEYYKTVKVEFT